MSESRERVLAWVGTAIAIVYFAWLGGMLFQGAGRFGVMFVGLGMELPIVTRFVIVHRAWVFVGLLGIPALGLVTKELVMQDKRLSMMITMLVVILVRGVVDLVVTAYYLPLFDMIGKLS